MKRRAWGVLKVAEAWFHLLSAELSTAIHCLKAKKLENLRFPWTSGVSQEYAKMQDQFSRTLSTLWTLHLILKQISFRLLSALHLFAILCLLSLIFYYFCLKFFFFPFAWLWNLKYSVWRGLVSGKCQSHQWCSMIWYSKFIFPTRSSSPVLWNCNGSQRDKHSFIN